MISQASEMVYNVSEAETQAKVSRRQSILNAIVLLLTAATLVSVTSDAYDFVRDQEVLISEQGDRLRLLIQTVLGLLLVVGLLAFTLNRPKQLRRLRRAQRPRRWNALQDPTALPDADASERKR